MPKKDKWYSIRMTEEERELAHQVATAHQADSLAAYLLEHIRREAKRLKLSKRAA